MTVSAAGAVAYRWFRTGYPSPAGADRSYVIASAVSWDAGRYTCDVTDGCGWARFEPAYLDVLPYTVVGDLGNSLRVAKLGDEVFVVWASDANAWTYSVYDDTRPDGPFADVAVTTSSTTAVLAPPLSPRLFYRAGG